MKRPLYAIGQAEPIGFEEVPEPRATSGDRVVDWDAAASVRKQAYDAYRRAGFSAGHSLELCKLIELEL